MSALLSVAGVSVRFGGVAAVDDVSLEVGADQLLGIIGPNGAGKTTLMRAITGLVRPQAGRVRLAGEDITDWSVDRRVRAGLALGQQIVRPLRSQTLAANVALAAGKRHMASPLAALSHRKRDAEMARARELLAFGGLAAAAEAFPGEVPLGYLKYLEVARALALQPRLLLLDEPLAGLNQAEASAMADLIATLASGGRSVLLIEHNLREVVRTCPVLYVQDQGRRLAFGDSDEVMADPRVRSAYLGGEAA